MSIKKYIGEGLKDSGPNLNVLNVLRTLVEDIDCICYIPQDYAAERKVVTNSRIHFNPVEAGKSIVITGVQSNQERFNFSLTGEVDVHVEYEAADGTVTLKPKKVFRTYTIIRDGKLVFNYIVAKLSYETFNDLRSAGILYYNGVKVGDNHSYVDGFLYKIMLNTIPVISINWAQPMQIGLYENLILENTLANTLTELNKIIKQQKADGEILNSDEDSIYFDEGYSGEEKVSSGLTIECVQYSIKDDKAVDIARINQAQPNLVLSTQIKKVINKELKAIRFINRCVTWAIEQTKYRGNFDWSDLELVPRSKEKYRQTCTVKDNGNVYELQRTEYKMVI